MNTNTPQQQHATTNDAANLWRNERTSSRISSRCELPHVKRPYDSPVARGMLHQLGILASFTLLLYDYLIRVSSTRDIGF